jgi:hypothetical protein
MAKATKTATAKKTKKETTPVDDGTRVAVICGYCGDSQTFKSIAEAQKWITEDMSDNGHGSGHYEIVLGKKVDLKVDMTVTWDTGDGNPQVISTPVGA